jgi:hypothetical protein
MGKPKPVRLEDLLDPAHPLLRLAEHIRWTELDAKFRGSSSEVKSLRLMLGLQILRLLRGLSDDDLCAQWPENPYFQAFCGETTFCHDLPILACAMRQWRDLVGSDQMALLAPQKPPATSERPATFVIDVDGVVATLTPGNDYSLCQPICEVIAAINCLYDRGHRIIMLTARGTMTGLDWKAVTCDQFNRWGLKYHELHFGKPAADYYVDDRMLTIDMLCAMAAGREFVPSTRAPGLTTSDHLNEGTSVSDSRNGIV